MKYSILLLSVMLGCGDLYAQNYGIGTSLPHPSAALEVKSNSSGILFPSMTSTQRLAILNPADGLLVYDLTSSRLYQYQNGSWKFFLNNNYWVQSTTRKRVYTISDSVGMGTSIPLEKLHVIGNIRNVGDLLTSGDINIDNPSAILQFQDASVNKSFVQLSGDNLRMGTNSGNSNGRAIFSMNGIDRLFIDENGKMRIGLLGITNPTPDLYVYGSINVSTSVTKSASSGNAALLPLCYGTINGNGTVASGSGNFTPIRISAGLYRIYCTGVTSGSVIIANGIGSYQGLDTHIICSAVSYAGYFDIKCYEEQYIGALFDTPTQFLVYK